jgi:anti-sigma factor RsiW
MAEVQPLDESDREELIAYLDGELSQTDAQTVEKRLNTDPRFRAEADALRKTYNLLDYLPKPEPTANFTERTLTRVTSARPVLSAGRGRQWSGWLGWAAAVVIAVVVGYTGATWLPSSMKPGSGDLSPELEQHMARDLKLLEHLGHYQHVNDIHLLNELDRPELFGDDPGY